VPDESYESLPRFCICKTAAFLFLLFMVEEGWTCPLRIIVLERKEEKMLSKTTLVDAMVSGHSHLREPREITEPLVRYLIEGGVDTILPMPNTDKGLTDTEKTMDYVKVVEGCVPPGDGPVKIIPCMMLTEKTYVHELQEAARVGIRDVKVYPLNRTTKSQNGVRHYGRLIRLVKVCAELGIRTHWHFEHPWMLFDNRDAEYMCLPIADMMLNETDAVIFWEHGSDARCIPFWKDLSKSRRFVVTLSAHHLATNEDATFGDVGATCKPPIKTRRDQRDLVLLVDENNPWVIAGPDDAAHPIGVKYVAGTRCACGAYTGPFLIALYAHALSHLFSTVEGISVFNNFVSRYPRKWFGLAEASRQVKLIHEQFKIPPIYNVGPWIVGPFWAGQTIDYTIG